MSLPICHWRALLLGLFAAAAIVCGPHVSFAADPPAPTKSNWPPQHMRQLPADYLERLYAGMSVGMERLERVNLNDTTGRDSIAWVRYGMPALILGKRADEINKFFESDTFVWTANPKFGFSLFSVSYIRQYGLMNPHTGVMTGYLTPKAIENYEKGMWQVAKANSKLAEAKRDIWDMEGSENHHLSSKSSDLLAAQFLRKLPAYANQTYDDGSTLEQQYEARRAYFLKWFDERAKRGQYVEAASPSYQADSVAAIFNIRDFAEDPLLRKKAEMYLDLTYAVIAEETLLTSRGGPKSRVKVGHEYDGGIADRGYDAMFGAPGREFNPLGIGTHATSNYYPPAAIVNLAKDTTHRGTYTFATRWPGPEVAGKGKRAGDPDGVLWRKLEPEHSILRKGFCTPNFVLGSAAQDPRWLEDASMGFRWQGAVFASDPLARIGFEVEPAKNRGWHGFNPFFSVQDRNILITQKWAPVPPNPPTANPAHLKVYFAATLDDVQENDGWIFVKDGAAFAAVKVVAGGYEWSPAWKHADDSEHKAFLKLKSEDAPVIMIVNDAADYGNDFAKFQSAVKSQPIEYSKGVVHFAGIVFSGPDHTPEIQGKPVDVSPARGYDSPFVRSDFGSGLIHIRKGEDTVILDFRDPQNPQKTVGAPVTSAFPPGVGTTKPIVFEK